MLALHCFCCEHQIFTSAQCLFLNILQVKRCDSFISLDSAYGVSIQEEEDRSSGNDVDYRKYYTPAGQPESAKPGTLTERAIQQPLELSAEI